MLGLPDGVCGCLFDLDGVLTQTAKVHGAAWKGMFDGYLSAHAQQAGQPFVPFSAADYEQYVDGKPRADGTRAFLASRGIELPEGHDDDPPDALTVRGLGNRKNEVFTRQVREDGVEAYPGSVRYPAGTAAFHINADIADAVIRYVDATGDEAFDRGPGMDLLVHTARLWRSLGHHDAEGRFRSTGSPVRTSTAPWWTTTSTPI